MVHIKKKDPKEKKDLDTHRDTRDVADKRKELQKTQRSLCTKGLGLRKQPACQHLILDLQPTEP